MRLDFLVLAIEQSSPQRNLLFSEPESEVEMKRVMRVPQTGQEPRIMFPTVVVDSTLRFARHFTQYIVANQFTSTSATS
jgi:hypothetical protein